jgi:outer membrane protein assembly factor BamB
MQPATRRLTLLGHKRIFAHKRTVGRKLAGRGAAVFVAGAACVVALAASGGAVASASSASPAQQVGSAGSARAAKPVGRAGSADRASSPAAAQAALPSSFWTAYLNGPLHTSYSPSETSITTGNASTLVQKWSQPIGAPYIASPIVFRGSVYIGGADGWFYRLSERTGQVLAKAHIGSQPSLTCPSLGVTATATIARNPRTHAITVYVAGGDGYLYALGAQTLARAWRSVIAIASKTVNDYHDWSSPTVANGKIYIGVASSCDRPLVRGAVLAFRQVGGARLAAFYTVPADHPGGTVWSSVAVAPNGDVFASTGNGPGGRARIRDSESILKLNPDTLRLLAKFQVPVADVTSDGDFGASPVIFGSYVGACNKNGFFYALRQSTMKLVWKRRIGAAASSHGDTGECLASPVYNGKDLFFGGNKITLGTTTYLGSVQERSASTGSLIRATGLTGGVMGSPTMDGRGVIAVSAYTPGTTGVYLVNATTGAILQQLRPDGAFAQSVFAEGRIFCATTTGVYAFGLRGG